MIDEERFFAWLDGELAPAEAATVEAAVARDPALKAKADRHRAMANQLRGAFAPVAEQPAALPVAPVVDFATAHAQRRERSRWQDLAALAATLLLGLVIGTRFAASDSPVAAGNGTLIASAGLDRLLDRQLASAPGAGERIGLTFRDRDGRICRTFSAGASSGLACRDGENWEVEALMASGEGQTGEFRMASGPDPRIAGLVDGMISGEPFDADQERAARNRGWSAR